MSTVPAFEIYLDGSEREKAIHFLLEHPEIAVAMALTPQELKIYKWCLGRDYFDVKDIVKAFEVSQQRASRIIRRIDKKGYVLRAKVYFNKSQFIWAYRARVYHLSLFSRRRRRKMHD